MDYNRYEHSRPCGERIPSYRSDEWKYADRGDYPPSPGRAYYPYPEYYQRPGEWPHPSDYQPHPNDYPNNYPNDYPPYPVSQHHYGRYQVPVDHYPRPQAYPPYPTSDPTPKAPNQSPTKKMERNLTKEQERLYGPLIEYLKPIFPLPSQSSKIYKTVKKDAPANWKLRDYINGAAKLSIIDLLGEDGNGNIKIVLSKEFLKFPENNSPNPGGLVTCRYCGVKLTSSFANHNKVCPNKNIRPNSGNMEEWKNIKGDSDRKSIPVRQIQERKNTTETSQASGIKAYLDTNSKEKSPATDPPNTFTSKLASYIPDTTSPAETLSSSSSDQKTEIQPKKATNDDSKRKKSSGKTEKDFEIIHNSEFNFDLIHQTDYLGIRKTRSGKVYIPTEAVDEIIPAVDNSPDDESIGTVSLDSDYEEEEEVVDAGSVETKRKNEEEVPISSKKRHLIISESSEDDLPVVNLQKSKSPTNSPKTKYSSSTDRHQINFGKKEAPLPAFSKDKHKMTLDSTGSVQSPNIKKQGLPSKAISVGEKSVSGSLSNSSKGTNIYNEKYSKVNQSFSTPSSEIRDQGIKNTEKADPLGNINQFNSPIQSNLPGARKDYVSENVKKAAKDSKPNQSDTNDRKSIHIEKPLNTRAEPLKIFTSIDIPEVYSKSYRKPQGVQRQNSFPVDTRKIKFGQDTRHYVNYSDFEDFGLLPDLSPNLKHPDSSKVPVKSNLKKTGYNPLESIRNFEQEFGTSPTDIVPEKKELKRLSFSSYMSNMSKKKSREQEEPEVLDFSPVAGFGDSVPIVSSPKLEKEFESIPNIDPVSQTSDYVIPQVRSSSEVEEFLNPIGSSTTNCEPIPANVHPNSVNPPIKVSKEAVQNVPVPMKPRAPDEKKYDSNGRVIMCAKCKNVPLTDEHKMMHVVEALKEKQRKKLVG
ncbi:hypothetical protein HK103_001387 [Boothiomyces macroporosus]|uniref:Uncharacterized protein n=1 Tax=Boothiomyces macroporosus TaxID=261099 RepID=A0AAD5UDZ4_9FUNG|nr:hypothetical protein HK103_001387 [Boothiomyces macroporosus]